MPTNDEKQEHAVVFVNGEKVEPGKKAKLPPGEAWAAVLKKQKEDKREPSS